MPRIFVVDDSHLMRKQIRQLIEQRPGWTVCGESANGRDAIAKHASLKPHITVMDFNMPMLNGLQSARQILIDCPTAYILILSIDDSSILIEKVRKIGIKGFCSKNTMEAFFEAVEAILRGETYFYA